MQELFQFLDNKIKLDELERLIYNNPELEKNIGKEDYLYLLGFNYKSKYAQIEIQDYILKNILIEKEYAEWKINNLFESNKIKIPTGNLFEYAKQNPSFLGGKTFEFKQLGTQNKIRIDWNSQISQFVRHVSELSSSKEKYLVLGTYEESYIHMLVNREGMIYIAYDVIDKEEFMANNFQEAIMKLILNLK